MPGRWPFRKLLPLVMTSVQLVLLALSLAQQWHLHTNPTELHHKFPPTAPRSGSDQGETVSFSLEPQDLKTSTVFKIATVLSLPAMFSGVLIGLPLIFLGMQGGDSYWIAISALLGTVMWSQIGRWIDEQRGVPHGVLPVRSAWHLVRRTFLRVVVFLFLALFSMGLMVNHQRTMERDFLYWSWIGWSSVYLLLSFWGERRETRLARAKAATQETDAS